MIVWCFFIALFSEDNGLDFFGSGSEQNRFNQLSQTQNLHNQRTQQQSLQNGLHPTDNGLGHQVYANNLSKFFDFHKNQQQQQQQQQFAPQQQQLFMSDQMNVSNLMDQSRLMDARRLNSQYLDQQNSSNSESYAIYIWHILGQNNAVYSFEMFLLFCFLLKMQVCWAINYRNNVWSILN